VQPRVPTPQQIAAAAATKVPPPRAMTQERTSGPGSVRNNLDAAVEAVTGAPTIRTPMPPDFANDLEPEIEIELELDDPNEDVRARMPRDTMPTDTSKTLFDSMPAGLDPKRMPGDSIPPLPPPPDKRASTAVGAAALPPGRKIARPPARPAITPPQVVTRPRPNESDAVEVYAPAPPSAELPGASDRPGQYAQHKKVSEKIPIKELTQKPERAPTPVPAGLGKPGRQNQKSGPMPRIATSPAPAGPPPPGTPRPRTPTPPRASVGSGPRNNTPGTGGVVMTRPAVIVGAPPKTQQVPRVRKAREDEGRGFGQGLISEKSLDEVILAYLSEDSDEK